MKINDLLDAVMQLDLEPIKMKLMHVASGEGWSRDKTDAVEREYRRFLCLMKMFSEEDIAPLVDVDTFWHYHILDTMKYAADCEQVFGYFLHHYPYVGMHGEDDEQFRLDSGERMRALYEATFGDAYPGMTAAANGTQAAYCAGPHAQGEATATAYCAGPHMQARCTDSAMAATAYCAGPHMQARRTASAMVATAYCAGPHMQARRTDSAMAATAYCAGPHMQARRTASAAADIAYCAGPHAADTQEADVLLAA